jgi:hypothetical protein
VEPQADPAALASDNGSPTLEGNGSPTLAEGNSSPPLAEGARAAAANAKSSVEQAANPVSSPAPVPVVESGRSPLPFAVAFAVTVLIALLVRRLRHRHAE